MIVLMESDQSEFDFKEYYSRDKTLQLRDIHIPNCTEVFYREDPLKIVRCQGTYMYDQLRNRYFDCINNVAHVGHSHPYVGLSVAALITHKDIMRKFESNAIEYFNIYSGNPVSCRAAIAVLDVIEKEHLQGDAHRVGVYLLTRLRELQSKYDLSGDVLGCELFIGIEIIRDRKTREPRIEEAKEIKYRFDSTFEKKYFGKIRSSFHSMDRITM